MAPNVSQLLTFTIENRTKKLADLVSNNVALLYRLRQKNNVQPFDGGVKIYQELEYAENATAMWYSGAEPLNVSQSDIATAAEYEIKQAAVAVIMTGLEELQNAGKSRMISAITAKVKNAERTLLNLVGAAVYADGTGTSGKELGGLQYLVADTPTGSTLIGGINQNTYSWWRNIYYSGATDGGAAVSQSNILKYYNAVWYQLVRNMEKPDFVATDNNYYNFIEQELQALQRITDSKLADAGFQALKYKGADVVLDGGVDGSCPSNHAYFLNTDYIFLRPHTDMNFSPLGSKREAFNQDVTAKFLGFAGNMTCSNRRMQGLLKA